MKRLLFIFFYIATSQAILSQNVEIDLFKRSIRVSDDSASSNTNVPVQVPQLDFDEDDTDQELLDHFEAPELSPLMEWLTRIGSETVAGLIRLKRALFAYLLKAKKYVIQ